MVGYTVTRTVGSKFAVRLERMPGFTLGFQVFGRRNGGVRVSVFGWSLWVGMVPICEVVTGDVANGDPLEKILKEKGRAASFSIEYDLRK